MADFSALKQSIQNYIKQNGNKEITGAILQNILLSMVTTMGDGAINDINGNLSNEVNRAKGAETTTILFSDGKLVFKNAAGTVLYQLSVDSFLSAITTRLNTGALYAGYATPSTTPATLTSQEVFYLATQAGTYTNFHFNGGDDPIVLTKDGIYFIVSGNDDDDWNAEPMLQLDDVPTASSNNAVKSGGTFEKIKEGLIWDDSNNVNLLTNSGFIQADGVNVTEDQNWKYSNYIEIGTVKAIKIKIIGHPNVGSVCFYDSSKNVIQVNKKTTSGEGTITNVYNVPNNTSFVRFSGKTNSNSYIYYDNYDIKEHIEEVDSKASIISFTPSDTDIANTIIGKNSKIQWGNNRSHASFTFNTSPGSGTTRILSLLSFDIFHYNNSKLINLKLGIYFESTGIVTICSSYEDNDTIEFVKYKSDKVVIKFKNSSPYIISSVSLLSSTKLYGTLNAVDIDYLTSMPEGEFTDVQNTKELSVQNMNDKFDEISSELETEISTVRSEYIQLYYNYFNDAINNGFVKTDGTLDTTPGNWRYSDMIPMTDGVSFIYKVVGHTLLSNITFYDSEENVLSTTVGPGNERVYEGEVVSPENTAFVRFCAGKDNFKDIHPYIKSSYNYFEEYLKYYSRKQDIEVIFPSVVYTTCNNIGGSSIVRTDRNKSAALYLDHYFHGITEEHDYRFKDAVDKIIFNSEIRVSDSDEVSPTIRFNHSQNIYESTKNYSIVGSEINKKDLSVTHRSTLNTVTKNVTPKVLCIGDSITYGEGALVPTDNYTQNHVYHLLCKEMFMKDSIDASGGYDVIFVGTRKREKTFTYKGNSYTAITHHEGFRGISMAQMINGNQYTDVLWDATNNRFSVKAMVDKYRTLNNNGVRLTLGDGTGTLITAENINEIDVCDPTHVIIMLGANGGGQTYYWQTMVELIKAEYPDMVIGIAVPDNAGTIFPSLHPTMGETCTVWKDVDYGGSRHETLYGLQNRLQTAFGTTEMEEDDVYMLPFFFVTPTAESVSVRNVFLPDEEYNESENQKIFEPYFWCPTIHSNGLAHANWAYSLYSWLKYTIAKNL